MKESYHFIGIGGIGMSALARILLQKGAKVSGSDLAFSSITEQLKRQGAEIFLGHSSDHIQNPLAIIYSTAVREENPEVKQARLQGVPFLHRSDLLHQLMQGYRPLLVTGTHGKTTTSSLLAHLLVDAGLRPSYAIGGLITNLSSNAGHGTGSYFVAEADESDGTFLKYSPFGAIITNIHSDHLDFWKTFDNAIAGYRTFIDRVQSPTHLFWCGDDPILRSLNPQGFSYGFDAGSALRIENFRQEGWKNIFDICFEGENYSHIEIPLVGRHHALNTAAVFGLGIKLGIPEEKIRKAFCDFKGVGRRTEFKGEEEGILILDDYGHHPNEIATTLKAIKQATHPRRLIVAFQPHRYTRTRDCLQEFGPAFQSVGGLLLTDIYSAGESPIEGVTTSTLLAEIKKQILDVRYIPRDQLPLFLADYLRCGDVLVTMGAGDITQVGQEVITLLKTYEK